MRQENRIRKIATQTWVLAAMEAELSQARGTRFTPFPERALVDECLAARSLKQEI